MHLNKQIINEDAYSQAESYFDKGDHVNAEEILNNILKKDNQDFNVLNFLGIIKLNQNLFDEAAAYFKNVIELKKTHITARYNLGLCCQWLNRFEEALEHYQKVLELDYKHFDGIYNSGVIYLEKKEFQTAESYFRCCLTIQPNNAVVLNSLGSTCMKNNDFPSAINCYSEALSIEPNNPDYNYNIGSAFYSSGDLDKAIIYYNNAASSGKKPAGHQINNKQENNLGITDRASLAKAAALTNLGVQKLRKGFINDALELFDDSLEEMPDLTTAHLNKAHVLLLKENFSEGFKEYEWRFKSEEFQCGKILKPLPEAIDLSGKRILIRDEQGLGDTIQFSRLINLLKLKGAYTIFKCNDAVFDLVKKVEGIDELIPRSSEDEILFDYDIALLSLLHYFNINLENIPADKTYIVAEDTYVKKWEQIIAKNIKYKVGIVWAGNPKHTGDKYRSCELKNFFPLFNIEEVEYYVLQKGAACDQLKDFPYHLQLIDKYNNELSDAAAAISCLDLVITVDTSIAHLAGAMGKETWVLLPFIPDWRWMLERSDSPWYPSVKLFRQKKEGDWRTVFEDLRRELTRVAGSVLLQENNLEKDLMKPFKSETVYLGLSTGENFGWGVCSKYIKKELSKRIDVINIDEHSELKERKKINGKIFHALTDNNLNSLHNISGDRNIGYTFFENELGDKSLSNSGKYDLILAGSSWCKDKLYEKGITNSDVLIQGVDQEIFYPGEVKKNPNLFIIFSGGKFEYRKSQDLVIKATQILQQKYADIILINAWYNLWPQYLLTMKNSRYINFEMKGNTWEEFTQHIYKINDLDPKRVITLPLLPNNKQRELYLKTDVGLFPNRCEGGTNLVLMEYMACGKPAIASFNSGHKDIINDSNSFPLRAMRDVKLFSDTGELEADWSEPSIDEIIDKIEFAYNNREILNSIGHKAANDMKELTWQKTAESLMGFLEMYKS